MLLAQVVETKGVDLAQWLAIIGPMVGVALAIARSAAKGIAELAASIEEVKLHGSAPLGHLEQQLNRIEQHLQAQDRQVGALGERVARLEGHG